MGKYDLVYGLCSVSGTRFFYNIRIRMTIYNVRIIMRNNIGLILLCASIFSSGCVTPSVKEFTGPDGKNVKTTKCNKSPDGCYETASASCAGGPYQVLSSESHAGGLVADLIPGPITWYGMTYTCGPSDGRMPDFPMNGPTYDMAAAMSALNPPTVRTNCTKFGSNISCVTR